MNKYRVHFIEEIGFCVDVEANSIEEAIELTEDISSEDVPKWIYNEIIVPKIEELKQ